MNNRSENSIWNTLKQMLYALQVIIILLAIPLLSYMELSHTDKNQNSADKNSSKIITDKSEVIAYNLANQVIKTK